MASWQLSGSLSVPSKPCTVPMVAVVTTLKPHLSSVDEFMALYNQSEAVIVLDASSEVYLSDKRGVHVLTVEQQHAFDPISVLLPLNSFSRKNIGFLYAVSIGACSIWDFDDDNFVFDLPILHKAGRGEQELAPVCLHSPTLSVNPYLLFGPESYVWPRGYAIEHTKLKPYPALTRMPSVSKYSVDVVQVLQTRDPDVDAMWRLQNTLPLQWHSAPSLANVLVAVKPHNFAPYNAQSTLVHHKGFWSLYLPHSVHGRVSDIWRSFIAQTFFPMARSVVAFHAPGVEHRRNAHSYLADFDAEIPLYERSAALIDFLSNWKPSSLTLPMAMHELYVELYTRAIVEDVDVYTLEAWLTFLAKCGYQFPTLGISMIPTSKPVVPLDGVEVAVQVNQGHFRSAPIWMSMNPELQQRASFYVPGNGPCPKIGGLVFVCLSNDLRGLYAYESAIHSLLNWNSSETKHMLYTHEDAVFDMASVRKFVGLGNTSVFSGYPHGDTAPTWNPGWSWWAPIVANGVHTIEAVPNSSAVYNSSACGYRTGQSDWFIIAASDASTFIRVGSLFRSASLFVEVAVPTIAWCVLNATTYRLSTDWDQRRNNNSYMQTQSFNTTTDHDVVHPVKYGNAFEGIITFLTLREAWERHDE